MASDELGALDFVASAAQLRATHYRARADKLREMAEAEPIGRMRTRLTELAGHYDRLAESVVATPPGRRPSRR
jgi:hypothetical protein